MLGAALGASTIVAGNGAQAAEGPLAAARSYLQYEAALVLDEDNPGFPSPSARPALSGAAAQVVRARFAVKVDERVANQVAGVHFRSVRTHVVGEGRRADGPRVELTAVERTTYTSDGAPDYTYTAKHRFVLERRSGRWSVRSVDSMGASSTLATSRLRVGASADRILSDRLRASERVRAVMTSTRLSRAQLAAADREKLAGRYVTTPGATRSIARAGEATAAVPTAEPARPTLLTFTSSSGVSTRAVGVDGGGPPYNYTRMKDWALTYADRTPVTYTRDVNDCTTFVSWALWKGGWAEAGSQSLPAVLTNRDNPDVWWWRCSDCNPRHSYTWGGAWNWQQFAVLESRRVRTLPYLTDLLTADVMQMDLNGYGRPTGPDHTMIVTGRNSAGQPLLSYHDHDTENKPLNLVIVGQDGPYWAYRT